MAAVPSHEASSTITTSWSISAPARVSVTPRTVGSIEPSSLWAGMTTESFTVSGGGPALGVGLVDLAHDRLQAALRAPAVVGRAELVEIGDPPTVIADPRLVRELPLELAAGNPLADLDPLEHRAAVVPPAADVVDRGCLGARVKAQEGLDQVGGVEVVAHLLSLVAEDRVRRTGGGALHEVGKEAMQLRPRMVRPREAPGAKADRRHAEVAPVFLNQQIGCGLGGSEQGVQRRVDRHRRVDPVEPLVVSRELEALPDVLEREPVRRVAVDLVGRGEDEGRIGAVLARR